MIFAQLNKELTSVIKYPITDRALRDTFKFSSLPAILSNENLPDGYVTVLDRNKHNLTITNLDVISDIQPILIDGMWCIEKTMEELISTNIAEETVEEVYNKRLAELVSYTEKFANTITQAYKIPNIETQTWDRQFSEALEWSKNKYAQTPILDMIAISRGTDKDILKEKALEKALNYQLIISFIVGKKQYFEDLLNLCTTKEELNNIEFKIDTNEIPLLVELLAEDFVPPILE